MSILSSAKPTTSNIVRQTYANIYNLINNRSNVPDPNDSTGKRKFVYTRMPRYKGINFVGFPFIILTRTRPSKRKGTASMTKSMMDYDFFIFVYTKDTDSNEEGNPTGSEQNEDITGKIIATLNNVTNRRILQSYGMGHMEFDVEPDEDELDEKTVFISEFDLRFDNNLTVTG